MSEEKKQPQQQPPAIGPYFFPVLLFILGMWCVYDGWFTTDPDMLKHQTFNRVVAAVLVPWSIYDFVRTRKSEQARKSKEGMEKNIKANDSKS
ncbi:MAG: hypothetical protein JW764_00080 [Chlorobiaceae bacterium]|nr:hypothetical protein [Chlorobiaceae bacterium]